MDVDLADGVTTVRIDHPPVNAFDLGLVDDALATVQSIDGPIVLTCGASTAAWTCEAKPLDRNLQPAELDFGRLHDQVPDWRERRTWACGPEGMLNGAEKTWAGAGIGERSHLERFAVSRAAPHGQGATILPA